MPFRTARRAGRLRRGVPLVLLSLLVACDSPSVAEDPPAVPSQTPGRVMHVEPRGVDDGSGAAEDPFGSLELALSKLEPGDTLLMGGGTYEERVDVEVAPGRRDAPVRVAPAPGQRPVLQGLLWLREPSWWDISGLNVTWDDDNDDDEHMVKIDGGKDWVLSDAEIWGARSYAAVLVAGDPERFALRRLHVHDTAPTNGTNEDHLIYLNSGTGGGVVEGCLLVGSPNGRAIKIGPPESDGEEVGNLVIRYNTMVDNRGPSNVQLAWRSEDNEIYRNIMVGSAPGRANVTAFKLRGDDNVVRDNLGYRSKGVLEKDVDGLEDGGGNLILDPRFATVGGQPYVPTAPRAQGYGHTASRRD
jgi:hypothetical protein